MSFSDRPNWDDYFLMIAIITSLRSPDPSTKHGCVIVDKYNRIVSLGYNGPPSNFPNTEVPTSRPDKYDYFIHAEMNAIMFANQDLHECKLYVTGLPCLNCLKHIIQTGIKSIICLTRVAKMIQEDDTYIKKLEHICHYSGVNITYKSTSDIVSYMLKFIKEYE